MKVLGITAEYDPFHNGHRYHLETAKAQVSPDVTLCVMSGNVTQRGELAVLDKWKRARIALDQGLDLVLELPFLRACNPAPGFAAGAVDILVGSGATHIAFGCEAEEPEKLTELARLQVSEADRIEELTRQEMKTGISQVKARQKASSRILGEELTRLSLTPNNILALEYLKRMMFWQESGRKIEAVPIIRKGYGYKEGPDSKNEEHAGTEIQVSGCKGTDAIVTGRSANDETSPKMAGGSAIRVMIEAGWDVGEFIPYDVIDYDDGWIDMKAAAEEMLKQLKGIVLRSSARELAEIRFVGEGIENRLIREIADAESYKDLLKRMTSRRYTTSTIRRMLICILLGISKDEADDSHLYGRILALSGSGRKLISAEPGLPFIANINRTEGLSEAARQSLEADVRAADLYNLVTGQDVSRQGDHRQKPYVRP